jgi:hypothetical protein
MAVTTVAALEATADRSNIGSNGNGSNGIGNGNKYKEASDVAVLLISS